MCIEIIQVNRYDETSNKQRLQPLGGFVYFRIYTSYHLNTIAKSCALNTGYTHYIGNMTPMRQREGRQSKVIAKSKSCSAHRQYTLKKI